MQSGRALYNQWLDLRSSIDTREDQIPSLTHHTTTNMEGVVSFMLFKSSDKADSVFLRVH